MNKNCRNQFPNPCQQEDPALRILQEIIHDIEYNPYPPASTGFLVGIAAAIISVYKNLLTPTAMLAVGCVGFSIGLMCLMQHDRTVRTSGYSESSLMLYRAGFFFVIFGAIFLIFAAAMLLHL